MAQHGRQQRVILPVPMSRARGPLVFGGRHAVMMGEPMSPVWLFEPLYGCNGDALWQNNATGPCSFCRLRQIKRRKDRTRRVGRRQEACPSPRTARNSTSIKEGHRANGLVRGRRSRKSMIAMSEKAPLEQLYGCEPLARWEEGCFLMSAYGGVRQLRRCRLVWDGNGGR